jgi:hypothetical protein
MYCDTLVPAAGDEYSFIALRWGICRGHGEDIDTHTHTDLSSHLCKNMRRTLSYMYTGARECRRGGCAHVDPPTTPQKDRKAVDLELSTEASLTDNTTVSYMVVDNTTVSYMVVNTTWQTNSLFAPFLKFLSHKSRSY